MGGRGAKMLNAKAKTKTDKDSFTKDEVQTLRNKWIKSSKVYNKSYDQFTKYNKEYQQRLFHEGKFNVGTYGNDKRYQQLIKRRDNLEKRTKELEKEYQYAQKRVDRGNTPVSDFNGASDRYITTTTYERAIRRKDRKFTDYWNSTHNTNLSTPKRKKQY